MREQYRKETERLSITFGRLGEWFSRAKYLAAVGFLLNVGATVGSIYEKNVSAAISQCALAIVCLLWYFEYKRDSLDCRKRKEDILEEIRDGQ